jgi:hypothetical protein
MNKELSQVNADDQQYQDMKLAGISGKEIGIEIIIIHTHYIRYLKISMDKFKNGYYSRSNLIKG